MVTLTELLLALVSVPVKAAFPVVVYVPTALTEKLTVTIAV
jgi:hypothetical protein